MSNSKIKVNKTTESRLSEVDFNNLAFGTQFADHMFFMEYTDGRWQYPEIIPYGPVPVEPSMNALHYGQAIFEGMKAYYADEHTINIFRPAQHHERLNNSARRMCIPEIDYDIFIEALETLLKLDYKWVPRENGTALYIRPLVFGSDYVLTARASAEYRFCIMASPVGAYYPEGFNPVKLTTTPEFVRAVEGGTGQAKAAGNYAAGFLPAKKAKEDGYTQVLWLDAKEHKYVEEVGTMNIHFLIDGKLISPALTGSILPGITRRSVLTLAKEWGIPVEERRISIDEVYEAHANGTLQEVFGSGTAAVISPVGLIHHNGNTIKINDMKTGDLAKRMFTEITDIQYSRKPDTHGWVHTVNV